MSRWRRLLNCVLGLGFLFALGGFVFHFVRHKPRCVITGPLAVKHLSGDGSRLVTVNQPDFRDFRICGPVRVWDLQRGKLLHQALAETDFWIMAVSPNGRHVAILLHDSTLRLFDCDSGEVHRFTFEAPGGGEMTFSRSSQWLCVGGSHFIDLDRHRIAPAPKGQFLCFNGDEHAVFLADEFEREIWMLDLRAGDKIAHAVLGSPYHQVSPDGSLLVAWRGEGKPLPERLRTEKNHGLEIWDLTTLKQRSHWMVSETWVHPGSQAVFSTDSRVLAYWDADASGIAVRFFDTSRGRPLGSTKIAAKDAENQGLHAVPPHGSVWVCAYEEGEHAHLVLIDAVAGRVIAKRQQEYSFVQVANDTVFWIDPEDDDGRLQLLDAKTGVCKAATPRGIIQVTPDGRNLLVDALGDQLRPAFFWEEWLEERWPDQFRRLPDTARVIDAATGRERFSTPPVLCWNDLLSDDGGTLVTVNWLDSEGKTVAIKVWDVRPTRAWLWAIGVPTAVAAAWALRGRFRRAHNRESRPRAG